MVIVPLLTLAFGVDIRYAIGASLVSVIATSSGAAAAYVREGYTNMRIGMFLEIATTLGALVGASLVMYLAPGTVAVVFGVVLVASAFVSSRPRLPSERPTQPDRLAARLRMDGSYPGPNGPRAYHVRGVPGGFGLMFVAGALSGLLGHRLGGHESAGDGSDHANSLQGFHHDQQFHDRRNRRGQRRGVPQSWIRRSRIGHAGDARRSSRGTAGIAVSGENANQGPSPRIRYHYPFACR